jgi:8-oxo-dGTP pyrophosphatase MutT (NUDIX family)
MPVSRRLLGAALSLLQGLRRLFWALGGRPGPGVLAVPLTREGKLVMIRLTYARGWRLPGGGVDRGEDPREAALRELAEEIGMTAHGAVTCLDESDEPGGGSTLFLVRDVRYSPKRTFEVEDVAEFALDSLPGRTTPLTRRTLEQALPLIRRA